MTDVQLTIKGDIRRIALEPGAVLVVHLEEGDYDDAAFLGIRDGMQVEFPNNRCVVLIGAARLEAVRE